MAAPNSPNIAGVAFAVTPHDVNVQQTFRAIYVGTGGDIVLVMADGTSVTFKNVPTGMILPVTGNLIKSTGTTATNLVGLA